MFARENFREKGIIAKHEKMTPREIFRAYSWFKW